MIRCCLPLLILLGVLSGAGQEPGDRAPELTLDDCITLTILYNRDIQEAYINYRKTDNSMGINRSDYLPHLDIEYDYTNTEYDSTATDTLDRSGSLVYSQRLYEFGKEKNTLVTTRAAVRNTFNTLLDTTAGVVSNVRRDFFFILLKQDQIVERKRLLEEFRHNLEIARAKFAKGQILEIDVFATELNVLNEELRINELQRTLLKRKMDLRYRLGCRIPLAFTIKGARVPLVIAEDEALTQAVDRSFMLTKLEEEIGEKEREIGEKMWEYMPQFTFQMGLDNYRSSIAVDLAQAGYVWGVDLAAEGYFLPPDSREATFTDEGMNDAFFNFQVRLPLFDGFKRREENALQRKELRVLRIGLEDSREDLVRNVLKSYQDYYERRERLGIVKRRVEIAKKRLDINEKLKEFGEIDDNQLETFRNAFFAQQDQLYGEQDTMIQAEENILRYLFDFKPCLSILTAPWKVQDEIEQRVFSGLTPEDPGTEVPPQESMEEPGNAE